MGVRTAIAALATVVAVGSGACNPFDSGGLRVSNREVTTGVNVAAGSTVRIQTTGIVDFGGAVAGLGAPKLTADGDSLPAPLGYPAPGLRKNSLIAKVGSHWYQGGQDASFSPSEQGEVVLRPNDSQLADNSQGWQVTISVTPSPADSADPGATSYGPFPVSSVEVNTAIKVPAGSIVRTRSTGIVDFGGAVLGAGAPKLTADGDDAATPEDYPAPGLRKNSLIAKVGSHWYQGGSDITFAPTEDGELVLRPNDSQLADNSQGWQVTITVTK